MKNFLNFYNDCLYFLSDFKVLICKYVKKLDGHLSCNKLFDQSTALNCGIWELLYAELDELSWIT